MKAYHVFSDLIYDGIQREVAPGAPVHGGWTSDGNTAVIGVDVPRIGDLEKEFCRYGELAGFRLAKEANPARGPTLILDDGKTLKRRSIYALSEVNMTSPLEAVRAIMDGIKEKFGEGRIWFTVTPVYLHRHGAPEGHVATRSAGYWKSEHEDVYPAPRRDQDQFIPNHNGDGSTRVLMGAYYFHENS